MPIIIQVLLIREQCWSGNHTVWHTQLLPHHYLPCGLDLCIGHFMVRISGLVSLLLAGVAVDRVGMLEREAPCPV